MTDRLGTTSLFTRPFITSMKKKLFTGLIVRSPCYISICNFSYFPFWFRGQNCGSRSDCMSCISSWSLLTFYCLQGFEYCFRILIPQMYLSKTAYMVKVRHMLICHKHWSLHVDCYPQFCSRCFSLFIKQTCTLPVKL